MQAQQRTVLGSYHSSSFYGVRERSSRDCSEAAVLAECWRVVRLDRAPVVTMADARLFQDCVPSIPLAQERCHCPSLSSSAGM